MATFTRNRLRLLGAVALAMASLQTARRLFRRASRLDLEGRTAVVTGGSRGLGLLLCEELAQRGANVAFCGRDPGAVAEAERRLLGLGVHVVSRVCDLGQRAEAEAFVDSVVKEFGGIDVLVNNAGIMQVAPLQHVRPEDVEEAIRANLLSAVYTTLRALPHLHAAQDRGRLVNIVSFGGRVAVPHMLGYAVSKFGMMGFGEALSTELRRSRVLVTNVLPSPMRTGSIYNTEFVGREREEFAWFGLLASLPLTSVDATRAARRIVRGLTEGEREVRLGLPLFLLGPLHGLAPVFAQRLFSLFARLLPRPAAARGESWRGREIGSPLQRSTLLRRTNAAALQNNEAPPEYVRPPR